MSTKPRDASSKPAGAGVEAFEEQAAPEVAAMAGRVAARYASARRLELEAVREMLTSAFEQIEQALGAEPAVDDDELSECVQRLTTATEAYAEAKKEEMAADSRATLAKVRAELEERSRQRDELAAAVEKLRSEVAKSSAAVEADRRQLAVARDARQAADRELAALREPATAREADARERAEAAEKECHRLRTQVEAAERAGSARAGESSAADERSYEHAVAFLSLAFDRLLAMYERFASGSSAEQVLDAIVAVLRTEFSRVVLFRVHSNVFEGVCQEGFKPAMDLSRLAIPRAMDSLLARAVSSNEVEMVAGPELAGAGTAPFGGSPTVAVAMPVGIDGEPLGVVYGDDSDQPHRELVSPELRQKFAELVRQQVTPFLARIAADRKRLADMDDYAAMLLKHLQSTHAADVRALMPERERQQRLTQNLEYARRLFAQRAQTHGPRAVALLDQRLAALSDAQPPSVLSRDLAAVNGSPVPAGRATHATVAPAMRQ